MLSQSPREWRKYFELPKVQYRQNVPSPKYDVHIQFFQDILLQYMCSKTIPTQNRVEMKKKKFILVFFCFQFCTIINMQNVV